mgnify:CR=1 FL=1
MIQVEEREISQAVIQRLPRYYRYLGDLLDNEVKNVLVEKLPFDKIKKVYKKTCQFSKFLTVYILS